jgi:carboxymethylenebutenolidase
LNGYLVLAVFAVFITAFLFSDAQADVEIKEWDIPTANSAPHCIVVDKDGNIWFTEIAANKIGMFDPITNEFKEYDIPVPSSRPHGLVADDDGHIWFAAIGAGYVGKLDPATGAIEEYYVGAENSGPHTPILAGQTLWFTDQRLSQIGKLDTASGQMDQFPTLTPSANPYGIVADADGNAWFAELRGHKIGKVDAVTGEVTEYLPLTENSGPRRIAIDSSGVLWFTQYNAGKIASFDPVTEEMTEYETSSPSSGPYGIWVDKDDRVWFSMTDIYRVGVFDQKTQTMTEYDLPTPNTHIKFVYPDDAGNIWFPSYNNNKIGVILVDSNMTEPAVDAEITLDDKVDVKIDDDKVIMEDEHDHHAMELATPLQQVMSGVKATSVVCSEGLELVLKQSNGQPACVRPSSVATLIERGWAIHVLPDYTKSDNANSTSFTSGDYAVRTEQINYFGNATGYLAIPDAAETLPAVIMIHEIWGINDNIKEMAEKLASHGYVVLAVDLYDGKAAMTLDEARALRGSFVQQQWTDNMNSAVQYVQARFAVDSIGSIGWCFGGAQSLQLALHNSDMDATVIYYGQLVTDPEALSIISWPVLGIFAGEDTGIPVDTVYQFEAALDEIGVHNEIVIYPGVNHAFANPSGDRYAPEESADAWKRTLEFFKTHLK